MYRLGLTGSIATGKSTVLAILGEMDIPVYSADAAVHELYQGAAVAPVSALFPGVAVDGVIDRARLSAALIAAPEKIKALEAVVHPLTRERMLEFLDRAEGKGADLAVLEIPLLFETGHPYPLDGIAVTACDPKEQRRRALARPGMSVEKLETILARQLPQAEKKERADFVIDTGKSLDETRIDIAAMVAECRARAQSRAKEI